MTSEEEYFNEKSIQDHNKKIEYYTALCQHLQKKGKKLDIDEVTEMEIFIPREMENLKKKYREIF